MKFLRSICGQLHKNARLILKCLLALGIFLLAVYRLSETEQPILFNDEIGYWSNCNFLLGKNWIPVTNEIGYYSYGYSLLLIPVRLLSMLFHWRWDQLYHAGVILNALLLVVSFLLALKIAERFMPDMDQYARMAACFVIFSYPSTVVYAHITWTECTLLALAWIFLYLMMRIIDAPGIGNHVAYAAVVVYMYAVHQRSLGILMTSVLVVLYLRLLGRNTMQQTFAYFMMLYGGYVLHTALKKYVQQVNYLGQENGGIRELLGYVCDRKLLFILFGLLAVFLFSYYWKKDRSKAIQAAVVFLFTAWVMWTGSRGVYGGEAPENGDPESAGFFIRLMDLFAEGSEQTRISTNDFSGQISKLKNLFTEHGTVRLGVSITGKWFYMASGSALIVSWSVAALLKNVWLLLWKHLKQPFVMIKRKYSAAEYLASAMPDDAWKDRIWFAGMFLAWFSTFMISAVYKEGLFKNDDLLNGRYTDFVFGFLMVYGLYCLIKDRYWFISMVVFMGVYLAAGELCGDILEKLQRTTFELAHCVLFGRVIWNYEPPMGKIPVIMKYVVWISLAFIVLIKIDASFFDDNFSPAGAGDEVPVKRGSGRIYAARVLAALLIPLLVWGHIGKAVVDNYVVVRNEKQSEPFVQIAGWIRLIGEDAPIYYVLDHANSRYGGILQFMLPDDTVIPVWANDCVFDEDAYFVVHNKMTEDERILENCRSVYSARGYSLMIYKNGSLAEERDRINW